MSEKTARQSELSSVWSEKDTRKKKSRKSRSGTRNRKKRKKKNKNPFLNLHKQEADQKKILVLSYDKTFF